EEFLEREIAERLGHDDVGPARLEDFRRPSGNELDGPHAVRGLELLRHGPDLGGFVGPDLARAELRREEREKPGTGADVGDGALTLYDGPFERLVKGRDAEPVGDQGAMIFDAHRRALIERCR